MEIQISGGGGAIAERNEEINRRRLQANARGGGPLRVTDPAALQRLMSEMQAKAEQQRAAEEAREEERRRREGAAYKTPEQRAEEARAARAAAAEGREAGEEARLLEKRFDPAKDFYQTLGIPRGASAADVRKAYKRLALLMHPDKYAGADPEQQAAVAEKFKQVVEAFDVLSDEGQRAVYDKCRDYIEANPGKGLPALSPEEAAMMRSGIAELARLRRQGAKATKHPHLEREVHISLEKLNAGCTKSVAVERRRVAPNGSEVQSTKNIHLVIRRGSREGDRHVFEGEGCESVDTMPGDLVLVLRQKPHPVYRRSGDKDLEMFAQALAPGQVLFAVDVPTIQGHKRLLAGSAFREAAGNGGSGGVWQAVLEGQGLYDAAEPWERPAGSLKVQLRFPACLLEEAAIVSCLAPRQVHLLGGAGDAVAAALAAGSLAGMLLHGREVAEMAAEAAEAAKAAEMAGTSRQADPGSPSSSSGAGDSHPQTASSVSESAGSSGASWTHVASAVPAVPAGRTAGGSRGSSNGQPGSSWQTQAVCLVVEPPSDTPAENGGAASSPGQCSPAAAAMLRALRRHVPGLQVRTAHSGCLLEDDWQALWLADVLILDMPEAGQEADPAAVPESGGAAAAEQQERWLAAAAAALADAGLLELICQRFWAGCLLVGIGQACALLGRQPGQLEAGSGGRGSQAGWSAASAAAPSVLPWYLVRSGGGPAGWASLHAALQSAAAAAGAGPAGMGAGPGQTMQPPLVGVGIVRSGCWMVSPWRGQAEMLVAPSRDALVATAAWAAQNEPEGAGLGEADDEFNCFCALQAR